MELNNIQKANFEIRANEQLLRNKESELDRLNADLLNVSKEIAANLSRTKKMYQKGFITSSTNSFVKTDSVLMKRESKIRENIFAIQAEASSSNARGNLIWIVTTSILYFILRTV